MRSKNQIAILLFASILLSFSSCKDKDDDNNPANPIEGCCGNPVLEVELGAARLYIPNMFTPNNDGINDIFYPFANAEVEEIETFRIYENGKVVYAFPNFPPNNPIFGWDGKVDGTIKQGVYDYEVTLITTIGESATYFGKVCNYQCTDGIFPVDQAPNCGFGVQHNGEGEFDPTVSPLEDSCM